VAQLGRALRSGRRGRRFKSGHPDYGNVAVTGFMTVLDPTINLWEGKERFKALEPDWRRLERRAQTTIFQTWDWCDCWLAGRKAVSPFVITVGEPNDLHAIFPFCRSLSWYGLPVNRLFFMGTGPADYGGFISGGISGDVIRPMAQVLREERSDVIDLHQLREEPMHELADALRDDYQVLVLPQEPTLVVGIGADFDAYQSRLSKKFRKNTVYADRRLRRDFRNEQKLADADSDIEDLMDRFFDLHQQRWLSQKLPGLFLGQGNRRFHKELARRLARDNRLVLAVTYLDDRPVAAYYGFKLGADYSYYLGGFDPEWSKFSVSSVLIFNLMKDACAAGFENFDFLRGRESYKLRWLAQETPLFRLVAYAKGPRGRLGASLAKIENNLIQRARGRLHD
jgi:CelD/BcsL family acetyltransferase involved in cellulose biosynthesis